MAKSLAYQLAVLACLVPFTAVALRGRTVGPVFWLLLTAAVFGPVLLAVALVGPGWRTGFSAALWVTIAMTMALFAALCLTSAAAARLSALLMPYLLLLGGLAIIWNQAPERPLEAATSGLWLGFHIAISVLTYGLLTICAMAALAVFLQERALKSRSATWLTRVLPAVADAEQLEIRLLWASEAVLALGVVTGMANQFLATGSILIFDHKTLLVVAAFLVIAVLLVAHQRTGLRGRVAARFVLVGYLLVTLGYPGVKFVTDVLLRA